jgi:hypothetical protein
LVQLIVAAVWGGLTVFLLGLVFYYRSNAAFWQEVAENAEGSRDDAIKVSSQALDAKQSAEDGFKKAKDFFEERQKQPLVAVMTDTQCENIAKFLEERLLGFSKPTGMVQ